MKLFFICMSKLRLVLLVDLDQTLIHTTNENVRENIRDVYHFQLGGPQSPWYHTRIRPKTSTFLSNISRYYELHIFTYGARLYAHTVAGFLDQDSKLFSHRMAAMGLSMIFQKCTGKAAVAARFYFRNF